MVQITLVAAALAATAFARPNAIPAEYNSLVERAPQTCAGQSCSIADLSRSTGRPAPATRPAGGSAAGESCITKHLTDLKAQGRLGSEETVTVPGRRDMSLALDGSLHFPETLVEKAKRQLGGAACKPFTLIFARGTTEMGGMGMTVGPALQSGLGRSMPNQWAFVGVSNGYPANMAGNDCIGLPGGVAMMKYLEDQVTKCPETKVVMSGYSQGAMAVHNAIAFAKPEAKAKVIAAVVFGDPFNGAPIKGFDSSKIKTYCAAGDGVCQGKFQIGLAHLAYAGADTGAANNYIAGIAKAAGGV